MSGIYGQTWRLGLCALVALLSAAAQADEPQLKVEHIKIPAPFEPLRQAPLAGSAAVFVGVNVGVGTDHTQGYGQDFFDHITHDKGRHRRLTDFGTVLMQGRVQGTTAPGMVKGKVRYLAPEYIADQNCSHHVDVHSVGVYSVGVVLFEMLTGQPAFVSPNATASMMQIVRDGLPVRELKAYNTPKELIDIVAKATHKKPQDRYKVDADSDTLTGAALHYFTGSKSHNIAVRRLGLRRGLKINEYGVFKGKKQIAGKTEEEVYAKSVCRSLNRNCARTGARLTPRAKAVCHAW